MKRTYDVKTLDEAYKLAVEDFDLAVEDLKFEVVRESKGFLGIGAKLEVEVDINVDGIEKGKKYIQQILDFNGYLIGHNSRNLIALQTLVSTIVNRYYDEDDKKIVLVDVGGYKKKREKSLEHMAVEWGKQVSKTKKAITITDLNSYERKIIHNKLSTWKDVETYSEGETPTRVLIISPKEVK